VTRQKPRTPGTGSRGRPISLPPWWLEAVNLRCGDRSRPKITEELNAVARRQPPFRVEAVYDFLSGKVTTDIMMGAFLALFPDLPRPVFWASSEEEARRFAQLQKIYSRPDQTNAPKVEETIEDTGEKTGEKTHSIEKTGEKTRRRAK
jgi:hypothetical protein